MDGSSFNEVFFNEVRVPDDHRLGDVNQGWAVALTTLMNEGPPSEPVEVEVAWAWPT